MKRTGNEEEHESAPERTGEEQLALLRDEHLSEIPALDSLLRRSSRETPNEDQLSAYFAMLGKKGSLLAAQMLKAIRDRDH